MVNSRFFEYPTGTSKSIICSPPSHMLLLLDILHGWMTHPNRKSNSHTRLILSPISSITKLYWCSLLNVMNLSPHSTIAVNALVWTVKSSPCSSLLTYHSVHHPLLPPSALPQAARKVALKHKSNHITPLPKLSQCFPIFCRIKCKLPGLVYQTLCNLALIISQASFLIISILCPDTSKSVEVPDELWEFSPSCLRFLYRDCPVSQPHVVLL